MSWGQDLTEAGKLHKFDIIFMGLIPVQCGDILDRQIRMEPLVVYWAKEEAKMAKIVRKIYVNC